MKVESTRIQINPQAQSATAHISDLQKQYLSDMLSGHSIESLNEVYLQQGWLLNFIELYRLLEYLTLSGQIRSSEFITYFKNQTNEFKIEKANSVQKSNNTLKLSDIPFFRSIDKNVADVFLSQASVSIIPAEKAICLAGETSRDLYILLEGEAAIYRRSANGLSRQFVSLLNANSLFGEAGFFLGVKRTADVITTRQSKILVVPYVESIMNRFLNTEKVGQIQQRFWLQQALVRSEFFKNIPSDSLDEILSIGKIVDLETDQILFRENDQSGAAYIIIQGSIRIAKKGSLINRLFQGDFFGEVSLMMNAGVRSAAALSDSPTKLLEIERDQFYKLLGRHLKLACELQGLAQERLAKDQARGL